MREERKKANRSKQSIIIKQHSIITIVIKNISLQKQLNKWLWDEEVHDTSQCLDTERQVTVFTACRRLEKCETAQHTGSAFVEREKCLLERFKS